MDMMTMLTNLASSYQPIYALMMDASLITGFIMVMWGLNQMRPAGEYSKGGARSPVAGFWSIGIGGCFVFLPSALDMVTVTFFAMDAQALEFAYDQNVGTDTAPFAPIKGFIQLFGVFSFMNGMYALWSRGTRANNSSTYKGAAIWILAGMAMVNIDRLVMALAASTGVSNVGVGV